MKAWDFEAVAYDGDVYCVDCLPTGINVDDEHVVPIFADTEVEEPQVCCECGFEHDYMCILKPKETTMRKVTVKVEVLLRIDADEAADIQEVMANMDYDFHTSIDDEADVVDTEIVDWSVVDSR